MLEGTSDLYAKFHVNMLKNKKRYLLLPLHAKKQIKILKITQEIHKEGIFMENFKPISLKSKKVIAPLELW